jgi:hypothetical protein
MDVRVSVDGGAEGSNITAATAVSGSINLYGLNTNANVILPVVSGLSPGVHTVRIRKNHTAVQYMNTWGFEILNEATNVRVLQGSLIQNQRRVTNASDVTLPPKPTALTGSRGGRVVLFASAGSIQSAVQPVNATQQNLAAADHANEEIARVYNFREFGAGLSTDFSTLGTSASSRFFTLEDGTTTLVGQTPSNNGEAIQLQDTSFIALTFVGTGLDAEITYQGGTIDTYTVSVDGSSIGTISTQSLSTRVTKLVSGLPYGTHVVRITRSGVSFPGIFFRSFTVYQPRKPSIPAGAIELADYNVMADFVANATAGLDTIATGVLRKQCSREFIYVNGTGGTQNFNSPVTVNTSAIGFVEVGSDRTNSYIEHTFFGTGFELRFGASSNRSTNISVTLNGLAATTANFPTLASSVYGTGVTFSSGTLDQNDASTTVGAGLRISGLPLARYTVRFNNNTASSFVIVNTLDIITPTHSYSESAVELQNSLPIGSMSMADRRVLNASVNPSDRKFRATANAITSSPTTTSTSSVPMVDMSLTVPSKGGWFEISYSGTASGSVAGVQTIASISLNGSIISSERNFMSYTAGATGVLADSLITYLPPGTHKLDVYWRTSSGTSTMVGGNRSFTVKEL